MTKEEMFKMASEAGFSINEMHCSPPIISFIGYEEHMEAFAKLVAEKSKQEQGDPVATLIEHYAFTDGIVRFDGVENMEQLPLGTKLYTTPQNRKPLTDEEILAKCESVPNYDIGNHDLIQFARAIEAMLKERNT